ncbi:MAG: amidohydrolase family protein [Maribacter sp.]|nr:amidohydrolase family protein [Maribacter sp.]
MKYIALLSLILFFGCNTQNNNTIDLIIFNVNVIDVITGDIIENQDVLIKDSTIVTILGKSENNGIYKERIDGTGKYLIPAFWDMHVHIQDSSYLKMFLDYGIVGVRDMGGCVSIPTDGCESLCPDILNKWKEKIHNGEIKGPELYISGPPLSGTGWSTSLAATSIEEVQNSFEIILNNQVDFVKVYENIPADAYREIARLCKIHNLDFAGHVSESLLLSEISDLGQKSIEHIREQILYCYTNDPNELESFMVEDSYSKEDREFVKPWIDDTQNAIEAFKRNKTWFVPTMTVQFARQRYNDSTWIHNPLRKQLPKSVNDVLIKYLERMRENQDKKGDSLWWSALQKLVNRLNDEGIGLLAGSDLTCEGGIPGFSLHEELKFLVNAGLSPLQALQTATINPATYFGLNSSGKVEENYSADLILLNKNPLKSIDNTLSINTVIRKGKIYIKKD